MSRLLALVSLLPVAAFAADIAPAVIIRDHRFVPAEIRVPAGQKFRLTVGNQDAGPEEFESYELNREKIIPGRSKGTLFVGPLKPGRYHFFGDFNQKTAQGVIIAE